jgi:hypothetical protein
VDEPIGALSRDRGVYLARAARAYGGAREYDHAATLGIQSLSIAVETRSGRTTTELRRLANDLRPANADPALQSWDLQRATASYSTWPTRSPPGRWTRTRLWSQFRHERWTDGSLISQLNYSTEAYSG